MTFTDFCQVNHVTIWSAKPSDGPRWRLILKHHDGRHTQMTLTVRSTSRPEAPAVLRAMVHDCKQFEDAPRYAEWCNLHGESALAEYKRVGNEQLKLIRFLGIDLYQQALQCTD